MSACEIKSLKNHVQNEGLATGYTRWIAECAAEIIAEPAGQEQELVETGYIEPRKTTLNYVAKHNGLFNRAKFLGEK